MVHDIVTFGQEVLRHKAKPVKAVTKETKTLVRDLLDSMYAARGVGLAAEQIGHEEAVCVIDVPAESEKPECVAVNTALSLIHI